MATAPPGQVRDLDPLLVLLGARRALPLDARDVQGVELVPLPLLARRDVLSASSAMFRRPLPHVRERHLRRHPSGAGTAPAGVFRDPGGPVRPGWYPE